MSLIGERMIAKPYKRILEVLAVGALAIGVVIVPLLTVDFVDRLEWRDYEFASRAARLDCCGVVRSGPF